MLILISACTTQTTPQIIDLEPQQTKELLDLYAGAGLNVMTLAVETFNQRFNKKINFDKIQPEKIDELLTAIHRRGIKTELYMMYAFPGQTKEELIDDEKTIESLKRLDQGSLLIIGAGPLKSELLDQGKSLVEAGRLKIIEVPYEGIPSFYRSADLFVLPSWDREAFGIVYLEAQLFQTPVIAMNTPGVDEAVGGGILHQLARARLVDSAGSRVDVSADSAELSAQNQDNHDDHQQNAGKHQDILERALSFFVHVPIPPKTTVKLTNHTQARFKNLVFC